MSLRMRLLAGAMRPLVRSVNARAQDPALLRRYLNRSARLFFRDVPFALYLPVTYMAAQGKLRRALWVSAQARPEPGKVLLYLHGGGYLAGSPHTHKRMVARLCELSGLRAFLPAYALAPEHPVPAQLMDAEAAHAHLLSIGYAPDDIVLGGDSAGGGMALALLARLCQRDQAPAAVFAWSPFCDQTFSGGSVRENAKRDHFFPGDRVQELARMILGDTPADDPRASPLFADFPGCPPVFLQVADTEILRDDAVRMAEKLRQAGAEVRLDIWPGAPHVWQIFDGWFPEAREAIGQTAGFIRRHLPSSAGN
ncbi:alpha/beta hydrolase [Lutimaribacter saemankumensis]|uniref:Acetyl esterase/lipase n=1 Tax=Lutimaribacter saemankumensis TaxID=490829 RepID=A0A1G8JD93_9RHOB|nr:alpha/beta hydrolase [Lutimaribacter saemankumensis]SDI29228.1 Acetyl esterase/lipase [Lutimaribacter saemankumensis]